MGIFNLVPRSLAGEAEGEDLTFGLAHKRSGNEIRVFFAACAYLRENLRFHFATQRKSLVATCNFLQARLSRA